LINDHTFIVDLARPICVRTLYHFIQLLIGEPAPQRLYRLLQLVRAHVPVIFRVKRLERLAEEGFRLAGLNLRLQETDELAERQGVVAWVT